MRYNKCKLRHSVLQVCNYLVFDGTSPIVHIVAVSQDIKHHGIPLQLNLVFLLCLEHHTQALKINPKCTLKFMLVIIVNFLLNIIFCL